MKKLLAIMLSVILILGTVPTAVFAGGDPAGNNGPADVDWAFITLYCNVDGDGVDVGSVYENKTAYNNAVSGVTYDKASNTLTLDNYRHPENGLSVNMMGNDFRLNVVGECELANITVWGDGWGGSITVTGDGTLTVNENRTTPNAVILNAEYVQASLTVDENVTLNLYGDEGVFSSSMNMFDSPDDVVKTIGGRETFELEGAPFYYQNSRYIHAFEITDSQTEGYKGYCAVKSDDPDTYYGVSVWTDSFGEKSYHVARYVYSQTYGIYLQDPSFNNEYGNEWGEISFTEQEFENLGFSMTVTGKELSSVFFFDDNDAHSGPRLINANDPNGIYMLDHNGYSYSDQNDPATYTFKGTIYKIVNGDYGFEMDNSFTPVTVGGNDYEALPDGFTAVMDNRYQELYLKGDVTEYSGNLHVDAQDNEYIVYNYWTSGQSHEYVYAVSEAPELPGCYIATYIEDIAGVENHGYTEVTVPEETGTYEFTTDVTEFSFGGDNDWYEEHIIHFKDATVIDSDTVVFGEGNNAITLDIVNAQLDENGDILTYSGNEIYNIEFVLSGNFDSDSMSLYVLALDGYRGETFISDGNTASFRSNDDNQEDLHFPYEVYISLDSFIPYVVAEDSYGNKYLDGDTLILEQGKSVFVGFFTNDENWLHGIFPSYGFNYGVEGEGNFVDSLTSMGFEVIEGVGEDFNLGTDRYNGVYGCLITAPANLEAGTRARMPFSLYELPDNFSWDDMWANFSWSDTPKVLENNMYIEVREPWELYCNATVYTPGGFEKTVYDGTTLYIGPDETMFIQVNSDFDLNPRYGVMNFYTFNFNQVVGDGFRVEFCNAADKGYPDVGFGIYIEADGNMNIGQPTELCFGVHYYPENENDPVDYENDTPAAKCCLNLEVRDYNPCIYAVDENGTIYNGGDTVFFGEDETKAVAFRTDIRNADHGFYQDYIGWNTDVLEDAGFTIIDAGPAAFFNDYKDDFWTDDFIFIISSEGLDYGTAVDFDTWLYLDPGENAEFDWEFTPRAETMTFGFEVGSGDNKTGDCTWDYDESTRTLIISGNGAMADYGFIPGANEPIPTPWSNYDIERIVIEDGVTHIGSDAFMGLNIYDADIADSVTSIGTNAFHSCGALDFVMLPSALTEVGAYAFYNTSLKEIEIPSTVTSIGQCAFGLYYDQDLDRDMPVDGFEIYGYSNTEAEAYADTYGFTFHDNTVYLSRDGLWKYCIRPDGAAMLYSDVFQGYSYQGNDTVVTIPSTIDGYTVKELGAFSMSGLTNVTKITVPDSVESIGFSAFSGCTNLCELVLGNSITEIGAQVIDNTAIPYKDGAVYCNGYLLRVDTNCEGMFIVNPGTKLMAMFSFGNCNKIERIILPDSINKIDYATFVGCTSLKEIFIPHSVGFIYDGAFTDYNEQTGQEERSLERIYGEPYTGAEAFANQNGIPFVDINTIIDYDLNGDYELTLADYQIARDYIAGNDLTIYGLLAGDVNDDGAVDAFDLFEIDKAMNANSQPKFTYTVENNSAYINAYTGTEPIMVIPDSIDGYRIIELDANAFKNNTLIQGAIVSGNVETIDNYAFMGCSNLEQIDFADGLKSIRYGSFLNCSKLDNVVLPDTVTSIGSYAFKGCTSMTSITIPSSVTTIQATAFTGCTNLTIYGEAGSYAETFATNNGIPFIVIA